MLSGLELTIMREISKLYRFLVGKPLEKLQFKDMEGYNEF
jgi:hypothetical protein